MTEPLDVLGTPPGAGRRAEALLTVLVVLAALLTGGCLLALLTQPLDGNQTLSALVVGTLGGVGLFLAVRTLSAVRAAGRPALVARLDGDGVHIRQGEGLPADQEFLTLPWAWLSSVSRTRFDSASGSTVGPPLPLDVLRFVVADDNLLSPPPPHAAEPTALLALWLGLTPTQVMTLLVGGADAPEHQQVLAWLRAHRPELAIVEGATAPWTTPATPDRWPGRPRVAVVGAHGRLGRHVVAALAPHEDTPPVAVVRNEAHRAPLERVGAEVRMLDLERQGAGAVASALRGCSAVVHLAGAPTPALVEGARRAGASRIILVLGAGSDDVVAHLTSAGLAWTAFRPASLTDQAPSGEVDLGADVSPGPVPRADLAEVIVAAIRDEGSVGAVWPITGTPSVAG